MTGDRDDLTHVPWMLVRSWSSSTPTNACMCESQCVTTLIWHGISISRPSGRDHEQTLGCSATPRVVFAAALAQIRSSRKSAIFGHANQGTASDAEARHFRDLTDVAYDFENIHWIPFSLMPCMCKWQRIMTSNDPVQLYVCALQAKSVT